MCINLITIDCHYIRMHGKQNKYMKIIWNIAVARRLHRSSLSVCLAHISAEGINTFCVKYSTI